MATVTLDQIWAAPTESLAPVLATQGLKPSGNPNYDHYYASVIYYNAGQLAEVDRGLVGDPRFRDLVTTSAMPLSGMVIRQTLRPSTAAVVQQEAAAGPSGETLESHFRRLAHLYRLNKETFRANTFDKAAGEVAAIVATSGPITEAKQLQGIRGIGKSTLAEAQEFLQTGSSQRLRELQAKSGAAPTSAPRVAPTAAAPVAAAPPSDFEQVTKLFEGIYGIGPVKTRELYQAGYRTIESLGSAKLTAAQQAGLKWYYHLKERIPRAEIDQYIQRLSTVFGPQNGDNKNNVWLVAGSYRRGEADSGDIDILMRNDTGQSLATIVQQLRTSGLLKDELALGVHKFMGIVQLPPDADGNQHIGRRLDIRLFEPDVWAYALLYNTGSQQFNILSRQRALSLTPSLTLNEYALTDIATGQKYPAATEQDIFNWLHIKYLTPEQRTKTLTTLEYTA